MRIKCFKKLNTSILFKYLIQVQILIRMLPLNRPGELLAASRAQSKTSYIEEVTAEAQHQGGKTEPQPPADAGAALGGRVPPRRPKMLDIFSGTGSVGEVFRRYGYEVISLDNRAAAKPDILLDICDWNFRQQFAPGEFDVIAAGVPCLEYSTALTTRPRKLEEADALVEKTPRGDRLPAATAVVGGKPAERSTAEEAGDGWAAMGRRRLLLFQIMGLSKAHADLGIAGGCGPGRCAM